MFGAKINAGTLTDTVIINVVGAVKAVWVGVTGGVI